MDLKAGTRLRSVADSTEVVIVRAPSEPVDLRCGGHPMCLLGTEAPNAADIETGFEEGTQLGKRYADETTGLEVLCTKAGPASLSLGTDPLMVKGAKPLPSSD